MTFESPLTSLRDDDGMSCTADDGSCCCKTKQSKTNPVARPSVERFRGWWSEGTPENEYEDSFFNIYTSETLSNPTSYTAIIDSSSSIKSNCGHPVSFQCCTFFTCGRFIHERSLMNTHEHS